MIISHPPTNEYRAGHDGIDWSKAEWRQTTKQIDEEQQPERHALGKAEAKREDAKRSTDRTAR